VTSSRAGNLRVDSVNCTGTVADDSVNVSDPGGIAVVRNRPRPLWPMLVAALALAATACSGGGPIEPGPPPGAAEAAAEERTRRFVEAVERKDLPAVSAMLDPGVTLVQPMTFSGNQEPDFAVAGRDQVEAYFREVFTTMGTVAFVDRRVSVVPGGGTSFFQANGDFTTADGRPYRNVYLFRLDWRDGLVVSGEEYGNPVTFTRTFGSPV
jgi:ketosteroid isomerase-like protein